MRVTALRLAASAIAIPAAVAALTIPALAQPEAPKAPPSAAKPAPAKSDDREPVSYAVTPQTTIERPGAGFIKVHVSGLTLAPGDVLTVSGASGKETHTYSANPAVTRNPGDTSASVDTTGFWAMSVDGSSAVVTIKGPGGAPANPASHANVDLIRKGLNDAQLAAQAPKSVCGNKDFRDVQCYKSENPEEFGHSPAIAKIVMPSGSCTAWRVNDANQMLTNNHCIDNAQDAAGTEVWFNFECPTCGGTDTAQVTKVMGDQMVKTNKGLDYTLFTVKDFDSIKPFGFLELDNRTPEVGEEMYIIGHPKGERKQLSIKDDQQQSGICGVKEVGTQGNGEVPQSDISYTCDSEPGSSGSPVLSRKTHKVIGLHHLGGCPNQGARIDLIVKDLGPALA